MMEISTVDGRRNRQLSKRWGRSNVEPGECIADQERCSLDGNLCPVWSTIRVPDPTSWDRRLRAGQICSYQGDDDDRPVELFAVIYPLFRWTYTAAGGSSGGTGRDMRGGEGRGEGRRWESGGEE